MAEGVPVQKVLEYRSKAYDNNRIIDALRGENYSFQQIRDAIQQADIKKNVASPGSAQEEETLPMASPEMSTPPPMPASQQHYAAPQMQRSTQPQASFDLDEIQRVLEEIIEEKWKESEKLINNIMEWKGIAATKIKEFDTRLNDFNNRINALNTVLGQKAEAFNETMQSVDTEIKALERALGKLVPTLSDNISELKELVGNAKKKG
ncbi:hypothetical protein COS83_02580 [archaeon CG07_land_8_20_14_0_80_38_8]|nr:MAG: hypothetical protein COS83_02580 [archaeon CG07_land_8_20_14_0_80_38_8]PIU89325.1 MAG: hypothetical protein COS64_00885 [archaeon CG06_land_8_20_14_3_00_37_11]